MSLLRQRSGNERAARPLRTGAEYLQSLSEQDSEFTRLEAQQRQVQGQIDRFRAADRLDRDEIHGRAVR